MSWFGIFGSSLVRRRVGISIPKSYYLSRPTFFSTSVRHDRIHPLISATSSSLFTKTALPQIDSRCFSSSGVSMNMDVQSKSTQSKPEGFVGAKMAQQYFRECDCVAFDVDSTVSIEEGIDVLAAACGKGPEVAEWTRKAMGGQVLFQDAIAARLDLIRPSQQQVEALHAKHDFPHSPGMPELFARLRAMGKHIVLISGGLIPMIAPLAKRLQVPMKDIYAIDLLFDQKTGQYVDFTREAPTASTNGKRRVVESLSQQYKRIVMIGDGVTDMEARPIASAVIGFGGNVVREAVQQQADWFVYSAEELLQTLDPKEKK